jgi:hypothetical protein
LELTKRVLLFKVFIFYSVLILTASFDYSNFHCFVGSKKGPSDDSLVLALSHIDVLLPALTLFNVL